MDLRYFPLFLNQKKATSGGTCKFTRNVFEFQLSNLKNSLKKFFQFFTNNIPTEFVTETNAFRLQFPLNNI